MVKAVKVQSGDEIKASDHNDLVDDIAELNSKEIAVADVTGLQSALNAKANSSSLANKADKSVVDALIARIEVLEGG